MRLSTFSTSRSRGKTNQQGRRGAALVEAALLLPLLLLFILSIIELGRAIMVKEILVNGAREGSRRAVLANATDSQVNQVIDAYMTSAGISGHTRTVSPTLASAAAGAPITITISVPYNKVSWLPVGNLSWMANKTLSARVVMRKEP